MYSRIFKPPQGSFFLFGPRGTGKSSLVKETYPGDLYLDFLDSSIYTSLLASPRRLEGMIPKGYHGHIILDEVQRVPEILNEVHRLIENKKYNFVLTGSSARKLRARGTNLLAGRALTCSLYPLTANELGKDFKLKNSLRYGHLPQVFSSPQPELFLKSYIQTYLKEEIQQEGYTRNLGAFARFLEAASFSQAQPLNISAVASECHVERKVVENYFFILQDLLLSYELPVFSRKAKRKLQKHRKFFFFDVGIFRALRPLGPMDSPAEIDGPAVETLVLQEILAVNSYRQWGYEVSYWRTQNHLEVDLVLYGKRGFLAIEIKRSDRIRPGDLAALHAFSEDYPQAQPLILYGGTRPLVEEKIKIVPITDFFAKMDDFL